MKISIDPENSIFLRVIDCFVNTETTTFNPRHFDPFH